MIEIKNKFFFRMLDGMLDAFDHLIQHFKQHFISGHAHYTLKVDILSSECHFRPISAVCILNQQSVFLVCFTSIFNQFQHVAALANEDCEFC